MGYPQARSYRAWSDSMGGQIADCQTAPESSVVHLYLQDLPTATARVFDL